MNQPVLSVLAQIPVSVLIIILLVQISSLVLFIVLITEGAQSPAKSGGVISEQDREAIQQTIQRALTHVETRVGIIERRLLELEGMLAQSQPSSPARLEHQVHELQKLVGSVVDKIKEF